MYTIYVTGFTVQILMIWSVQEKFLSRRRVLGNIFVYISIGSHQRAGQFLKLKLDPKADWGQGSQM